MKRRKRRNPTTQTWGPDDPMWPFPKAPPDTLPAPVDSLPPAPRKRITLGELKRRYRRDDRDGE